MDKKITINVSGAIRHYNLTKKPKKKMTLEILGQFVFRHDIMIGTSTVVMLSNWNKGERLTRLRIWHLEAILEKTGIAYEDLVNSN